LRARSGNSARRHRRAFRSERACVRVETAAISRPFPGMSNHSFPERSASAVLLEGMPPIHGDRVQLQQVILNLIVNAIEAMSGVSGAARGLWISTEIDASNGALVAVRDSGLGLDPASLEHLFDAFYTTKPSGMGMGLSICRSIIEAHGGRIWAEGNVLQGATFRFTLPWQAAS
jgi:signal transduction histidine kinase